jgi:hypothetical protein
MRGPLFIVGRFEGAPSVCLAVQWFAWTSQQKATYSSALHETVPQVLAKYLGG